MKSLDDFLDQEEEINNDRFTIENDQQANRALRKLRQLQDQKQENISLAESEIEKIEHWLRSVNVGIDHSEDYFKILLTNYATKKRKENPKFKTLKLPNGKISFR